jgi:hypothetical protein
MARTRNYIESISEDFDHLDSMSQADIVCELFARLGDAPKVEAYRRITNHAKMESIATKRNGKETPIPPRMTDAEVAAAGQLALAPEGGPKQ